MQETKIALEMALRTKNTNEVLRFVDQIGIQQLVELAAEWNHLEIIQRFGAKVDMRRPLQIAANQGWYDSVFFILGFFVIPKNWILALCEEVKDVKVRDLLRRAA
jgi:hypothetical protein